MSLHTTFKIGGPADVFIKIRTVAELKDAVRMLRQEAIPYFVLGGGANILVADKGIRGVVLDISALSGIRQKGSLLEAGAGVSIDILCEDALARGLGGLENFYGMPGTLGGAIYMNARCYERDISETIAQMVALAPDGTMPTIGHDPSHWSYKHSPFQKGEAYEGWIIIGAALAMHPGDPKIIARTMRTRKLDRTAKGHYRFPSAGSMFKNNRDFGAPTGAILDSLGLKGFRIGDAGISPWHANIFINHGSASAGDMRRLIETARQRTFETFGYRLEPEVLFVGEF